MEKNMKCVIGTNSWGSKAYEKAIRGSYVDDTVIEEAVNTALDLGLTVFDTAEDYGFGYAQKLLGRLCETEQMYEADQTCETAQTQLSGRIQISTKYTPVGKYHTGQVRKDSSYGGKTDQKELISTDKKGMSISDRKNEIRRSYELTGKSGSFYDGMMTHSQPLGKVVNYTVWGFDKRQNDHWIAAALSGVPDNFSGKLLEVPVGTGVLTMPLYRTLPDATITCLDYSPDMMENAKKRAEDMGIRNVTFLQGDVGQLPFPDESFDIVLSLNGFHAFPDKETAYDETFRVLKKGGIFCGCFYIKGKYPRTDWIIKHVYEPMGVFTKPYESRESLEKRLAGMYRKVKVKNLHSIAVFKCRK